MVNLGPTAHWNEPLVRAVGKGSFTRSLIGQITPTGKRIGRAAAESLVAELSDQKRWEAGRKRAEDLGLRIGLYTVWATFSIPAQPYAGLPFDAQRVACALGLDDADGKGIAYVSDLPLLLLEYVPDHDEVKMPTMIEAWATDPPNYYFTPAPESEPVGWTQPWPSAAEEEKPRPEVVHRPVGFAGLRRVVIEVD
jgi:hypothetical protein